MERGKFGREINNDNSKLTAKALRLLPDPPMCGHEGDQGMGVRASGGGSPSSIQRMLSDEASLTELGWGGRLSATPQRRNVPIYPCRRASAGLLPYLL